MGWIVKIIAILAQLQNVQLIHDIEQCMLTNNTLSGMWQCILAKLNAASPPAGSPDKAVVEAAKVVAAEGKL